MGGKLEPFRGEERFAAAPGRVFAAMRDVECLARAIPDLVSHERVDERTLKGTVRPGFSFLRASMRMVLRITDAQVAGDGGDGDLGGGAVVMAIESKGIGASMEVACRIEIAADGEGGSRIGWEADVQNVSGLLKAVSPTLIRSAAEKTIGEGWEAMRAEVEKGWGQQ